MRITASNIIRDINQLPRDREYCYVNPKNSGRITIESVQEPEGPIQFRRFDPKKGKLRDTAKIENISSAMIWRLANALVQDRPINVDRIFAGSYNTRSVLEALVAHTPSVFVCRPGRIEASNARKLVKPGHKHLIYLADRAHPSGKIELVEIDVEISEINSEAIFQKIDIAEASHAHIGETIENSRRHAQIQIALIFIGNQLGFKTWVAANDRSITYKDEPISQLPSVIDSLSSVKLLTGFQEAASAARLIDCVWFQNGRMMPAVLEIEHSTGVASGLTRMKRFFDLAPAIRDVRWAIVAPDEDRQKVMEHANREQFREMRVKFFPYSAVEELYALCDRRKPKGISDAFLDCFMEECVL
ncbi:MAG: hypothetical protein RL186_87 [Pseudomonadota bacterium]|jgi:type II restriction enzyme